MDLYNKRLKKLPKMPFYKADISKPDYYDCSYNELSSLENAPEILETGFLCSSNKLKTLHYSPKIVKYSCFCDYNVLVSLMGSFKIIGERFYIDHNNLFSIDFLSLNISGILWY